MDDADGEEGAGAQIDKRGVGAEDGGEGQLEEGAQEGGGEGDARVGQAELIEVVDVGQAEDDGGEKNGLADGGLGDQHQGDRGGAKEDFFRKGTLIMLNQS